ncbi:quinol:cytochrome c oxidoreductase quinone-binding subunit 2 [Sphingobacterium allocomposti]|uniref:Quinol:cytochrome c oxidoreductase quinone-binding subunit 2 n=1 Tax=Sphingobacterium allocomposti TaxID=415956 RepID=A0A5S5DUP9_9SPHI|nr:quinol:cytochrome C oxidoreductase [Sphingobacterium composti Yoo et al. 2007 non Ten et al. 2007]TYP98532.1 quinol:cytochrome c oxidoreductase quinone-binding subunit 2 [Sphingobacterium composti Yoo et al. 2007 non Ten et al. 2007]
MGTHNHHHDYNFSERFQFAGIAKILSLVGIAVGVIAIVIGLMSSDHIMVERTYANLLLMGYYFTCVCAAGAFFVALQMVTQSGWSAGLLRIPQAMASVLPIAAIVLLVIVGLGLYSHNLYHHWHAEGLTDPNSPNYDKLVAGKSAFLNVPGFLIRQILFMGTYSIFAFIIANLSYKEDLEGGLNSYKKSFKLSAIFLVIFGFTTPIWSFDTVMSLEAHWFSTMFGWYNFAAMWVSGIAAIVVILVLVKKAGYLAWVNENHLHDLGKLMFGFSIFWTYVWFAQFMLIWYSNIPEETVYFYKRWEPEYKPWFWLNIVINFLAPLLLLVDRDAKRKQNVMLFVAILLLCGHWLDYYIMIMPGTVETHRGFGYIEVGTAIGFVGLFTFLVLNKLSKHAIAPKNHPFLDESLHHQI